MRYVICINITHGRVRFQFAPDYAGEKQARPRLSGTRPIWIPHGSGISATGDADRRTEQTTTKSTKSVIYIPRREWPQGV